MVPPCTGIEGKVALVTGASRGIGAAIARALDDAGARVVLVARDAGALEAVASGLAHPPVVVTADLADPDEVGRVASAAQVATGTVDILVNNAGVGRRLPTHLTDARLIDELLAVNVRAPLLLCAALVPGMVARRSGCIVNLTSVSGLIGTPHRAAYAASKGAMDAATRSMAAELGPHGVRVNAVAPGVVDTDMWARAKAVPGVVESVEALTPLRRWATPQDVADVVVFLSSDAARFVTGETVMVGGGLGRAVDLYADPAD